MVRLLALLSVVAASIAGQTPTSRIALTVDARALQPGEVVMLTTTLAAPAESIAVRAFGHDVPAFKTGAEVWQAIIGIDLDTAPGPHLVSVDVKFSDATSGQASRTLTVRPKQFATRRLTVDPDFVNPPPEAAERIAQEARELERLWNASATNRLWVGAFARPVPQDANSAFGTRSIFNGEKRNPHSGADFLSPTGTPVHAPNAGRVVLARNLYYSGNTVIIDHGLGLFSLFAHLSEINVETGAVVARGDVVGKVGATGRVTGAHLHWSVRLNGARVDPLSLLEVTRRFTVQRSGFMVRAEP